VLSTLLGIITSDLSTRTNTCHPSGVNRLRDRGTFKTYEGHCKHTKARLKHSSKQQDSGDVGKEESKNKAAIFIPFY
jgi:hypothetical protein